MLAFVELSMSSNFFDWAAPDVARKKKPTVAKAMVGEVGRTGFEPATPWSQTTYSTGLNYLPKFIFLVHVDFIK